MSAPRLRVLNVELRVLPMRTRIPFRYGITTLTAVPHLFVQATVEVDGQVAQGFTSEGLPPKWFTKNPRSTNEQDLQDMLAVIESAAAIAPLVAQRPATYFEIWQAMQERQGAWAGPLGHPPLLWHFGVSLMERAVLDALCRKVRMPLHACIQAGALAVNWSEIHPELKDCTEKDFLPAAPVESAQVRHTIGLVDPILMQDIPAGERLHDGLPQALEECIPAYGLRYFKVKVSGDAANDLPRLRSVTATLLAQCEETFHVTLDGNENFHDVASFRAYFEQLQRESTLKPLLDRLLWVEQPLHRDEALSDAVGQALREWPDAPALIIDESDGSMDDGHRALDLGYSGMSHKNCKGIVKGLANAALIHHRRRLQPEKKFILSAEDLCIAGPIALMQDLAMHALLGTTHVERNGHHYFRGLTPYPEKWAAASFGAHPDMYTRNADGLRRLKIVDGAISLKSVNQAPFGYGAEPGLDMFPLVKDWVAQGGIQKLDTQPGKAETKN
jgi:hypothetical protein